MSNEEQTTIQFPTTSPINRDSISRQNKKLFDYLLKGNKINFIQAREMGISFLNSRISDLRNINKIDVKDKMIRVGDTNCKEYWINV